MGMKVSQRSDYTFKQNQKIGRHGWLRLTPAYSVKLVKEIIENIPQDAFVLDPFSGTATTGLVASEHGLSAHCLDINPFLIWIGNAKCRNYSKSELNRLIKGVQNSLHDFKAITENDNWLPAIHNINRWWCRHTLKVLAALRQSLVNEFGEPKDNSVFSLAWIAFCRLIIETSSAAFNHVSMSFHDKVVTFEIEQIEFIYQSILDTILESATNCLAGAATVHLLDSMEPVSINNVKYSHVVTSPPYPNRISYIRELRPYMYWTKYLDTAREAGELDWQAIGGTWGIATSRLQNWNGNDVEIPETLQSLVSQILETGEKNALLMAKYVWKYFHDMYLHLQNLRKSLKKGAVLSYIVGNSSFYGTEVHTEQLLESSLRSLGFTNVGSKVVRKRNSKKELFEYCVYATWQESCKYEPTFFKANRPKAEQLSLF
ncbi:MAG: DNA adenine methylase [Deltaproteobacteria bacterium]|jgi:D12 class N6 adenine-specific DNA methyltransferase